MEVYGRSTPRDRWVTDQFLSGSFLVQLNLPCELSIPVRGVVMTCPIWSYPGFRSPLFEFGHYSPLVYVVEDEGAGDIQPRIELVLWWGDL